MVIRIKYKNVQPLEKLTVGDWIDLTLAENLWIKKDEHKLVPLGVAMELPEGYEAWIAPRSSTFKKYGLIQTNTPGIVDNTFCGDNDWWFWSVYATRDVSIPKGTRVCQFRIMKKMENIDFVEVDILGNKDRNGCGSTGD